MFRSFMNSAKAAVNTITGAASAVSANPPDDDNDSSPGASDNEEDSPSQSAPASNKKPRTPEVPDPLAARLEATLTNDESLLTMVQGQKNEPARLKSVFDFLKPMMPTNHSESSSSAAALVTKAPTPPKKTSAEIAGDLEREAEEKRETELRLEQDRLDAEPPIAKNLRKAFQTIDSVLLLLDDVFVRFFPAGPEVQPNLALLHAELAQEETLQTAYHAFVQVEPPIITADIFESLQASKEKLDSLSSLWQEVFRFYAIAHGSEYAFSMQPIFKLRAFYDILTKSNLANKFHQYMRSIEDNAVLVSDNAAIQEFISTVELVSARIIILYKMLNQFRDHIDCVDQLSGKQHYQFVADDVSGTTSLKKLTTARDKIFSFREELVHEASNIVMTITVYEEQLRDIKAENPINIDDYIADKLKEASISAERVRAIFAGANDVADDEANQLKAALISIIKHRIALARQELDSITLQVTQASTELHNAYEEIEDFENNRAAEATVLNTLSLKLQANKDQALKQLMSFFNEYVLREGALEQLTFSALIQVSLFDINANLLNSLLSEYCQGLDAEVLQSIKILMTHTVRNLQPVLTISDRGIVEIVLQDIEKSMFSKFCMTVNGNPRSSFDITAIPRKISTTYLKMVEERKIQNMSDQKIQIDKLLRKITSSIESNVFRTALSPEPALLGLYILLSATLSKKGAFRKAFREVLLTELGYDLLALDQAYATIEKQHQAMANVEEGESTTRASVYTSRGSISAGVSSPASPSGLIPEMLDYLFSEDRTAEELATNGRYPYGDKKLSPQECDALTTELQKTRYLTNLNKLVGNLEQEKAGKIQELERKRLKRLMKLLEQLSLEQRAVLSQYPVVQLIVLGAQIATYQQELKKLEQATFRLDKTIIERTQSRKAFLEAIFDDFYYMYTADHSPTTTDLVRHVLLDVYRRSLDQEERLAYERELTSDIQAKEALHVKEEILQQFFELHALPEERSELRRLATAIKDKDELLQARLEKLSSFYEGRAAELEKDNFTSCYEKRLSEIVSQELIMQDQAAALHWYERFIESATEILQCFSWLGNAQLRFIFASFSPAVLAKKIVDIRQPGNAMQAGSVTETILSQFDHNEEAYRRTTVKTERKAIEILSGSQIVLLLACQAAIFRFRKIIIETKNEQLIVEGSRYNWFLQLQFLHLMLKHKGVFSEQEEDRKRERSLLKIVNQLITHHANLAQWMRSAFSRGDEEVKLIINEKSDADLEKGAYFLIALFFNLVFAKERERAVGKNGSSNDARFFYQLMQHFNDIIQMMSMPVLDEHKAVFFSMAVYLLTSHQEELLSDTAVHVLPEEGPRYVSNTLLIKGPQGLDLDAEFVSTRYNIQIKALQKKSPKIFSSAGATCFAETLRTTVVEENIVGAAVCQLGIR